MYEHALGFLDRLVERAKAKGFDRPCNRLEAQSLVWSYKYEKERIVEESRIRRPALTAPTLSAPTIPSLQDLAKELRFPVEFLERVEKLLEDKRQVIFQGPPGTGKTYTAKKLAVCLAGSEGAGAAGAVSSVVCV